MENKYQSKISADEINALPVADFDGQIIVVEDESDVIDEAVHYFRNQHVIGFDTETKPNFHSGERRNGVALLQLSGRDRAYLFRICKMGLDKRILSVLSDKRIIKIGAAVRDDINGLKRIGEFSPASFVDLQSCVASYGIEEKSVRKMAGIILGIKVSKTQQLSNWEAPVLSDAQIKYAAIDAWVCREMFMALGKAIFKED